MTKEDFAKSFSHLCLVYGKDKNSSEAGVWYGYFKDYPSEILEEAIKEVVSINQYFPSIAELKRTISEIANPDLKLNAHTEWQEVLEAIHKYGYYGAERARKKLKPFTADIAFNSIGWNRMCDSTNIEWERKLFVEVFENKQYSISKNQSINYIANNRNQKAIDALKDFNSNLVLQMKMPAGDEYES